MGWNTHQFNVINYSQNQRWINVIDVDSTSQQCRVPSGVLAGYVGNNELGYMDLICIHIIDTFTCFIHITIVHVTTIYLCHYAYAYIGCSYILYLVLFLIDWILSPFSNAVLSWDVNNKLSQTSRQTYIQTYIGAYRHTCGHYYHSYVYFIKSCLNS